MYKLGIIGGMGPDATVLLYDRIIKKTKADCDQEHIDFIILNHSSIPDRTSAILKGGEEKVIDAIASDLSMLEKCGVSYAAIPCNTSHCFLEKLSEKTDIHIINMISETVEFISSKNLRKPGIMCTVGTLKAGLYKKECEKRGITLTEPDEETENIIMDIIYNQIKKGEKGNINDFNKVTEWFKNKGCDCILIACTELSCIMANYNIKDSFYADALDVLADKSIILSGGEIRNEIR